MASLDIFNDDAFSLVEMTDAMESIPYVPRMLGNMGLFTEKRLRTTYVAIEFKEGKISLIPTSPRGSMNRVYTRERRKERVFKIPHVPYFSSILADDVQNIRAFGSETELESVQEVVAENLTGMRNDHEATQEWFRVGAIKGLILDSDADLTILYDLYDEFDVTQKEVTFDWNESLIDVCNAVIRLIAGNLGGRTFGPIYCICGDNFFDAVTRHAEAEDAAQITRDPDFYLRPNMGMEWYSIAVSSFFFKGITFINYRGQIGDQVFIPVNEGYFYPSGVPGLFVDYIAPGDMMDTVNTLGRRIYASQERLPHNKGIELHTQSNVLSICREPGAIVKATLENWNPSNPIV